MTKQTILIADDNERSLKLLKAIYEAEGYSVMTAGDGLQAIDVLTAHKIDLIVTDVLMPNMDGYYLCYKIRTHVKFKDIPVIIYTATYTSISEESVAKEMGADLFIRKPAAYRILINAARELLTNPPQRDYALHPPKESIEIMHQYSSHLINKLEAKNIELEETKDNLELILHRFKMAESKARLGHWENHLETGKVSWSDETFRILGLKIDEIEPSLETFMERIHPDDLNNVRSSIQNSLETITPHSFYHRIVQPEGTIVSVYVNSEFEFNHLHQPVRLYGTILDISELVEKEKNLERTNKELETLIYRISHDLRGPIASSQGLLSIAKTDADNKHILNFLETIDKLMGKQDKILINLVKVMSIKSRAINIEPFDVLILVNEVVANIKAINGNSNIHLEITNLISQPILSDRESVSCILFHLLENAFHFRRQSSIPHKVTLNIRKEGGKMSLEVGDNGTGIEESIRSQIYDMFYRGSQASGGTGLGLYIVRNAVEKIGASIEMSPQTDHGTLFKVMIPLLQKK
ncbi:MAG TPA: response regulator [Bacteroidia bacterium]|jgi:signal transduction histidine kinase/CheY-like chemotaxis protein|nr:response regulator [Bacteroidia bacterium]